MRGFCNWILPGKIMVGQYPGLAPEVPGPSEPEVRNHLKSLLLNANVNCFVSLQSEIPAQNDWIAWNKGQGRIYLDPYSRRQFPKPFVHYAPLVQQIVQSEDLLFGDKVPITYIHWPIEDLATPQGSMYDLLDKLLTKLIDDERTCVYIHCWGGRGRAGLTAGCLMSLLYPNVDGTAILDHIQRGYDSRLGADQMPFELRQSPQTEAQRQFVREFAKQRSQAARRLLRVD